MTELKKFDEIEIILTDCDENEMEMGYHIVREFKGFVKAEAVKWLKEITSRPTIQEYAGYSSIITDENQHPRARFGTPEVIKWIKHFFDITEDDLK